MRGSMLDSLLLMGIILALFFGGMLTLSVSRQVNTKFKDGLISSGLAVADADKIYGGLETGNIAIAKGIMFLIFAIAAVTLAFAYLVPAHPILMIFTLFVGAIAVILSVVGKSLIERALAVYPSLATQIPGTVLFWNTIPVFMSIYVALLIVLMYYGYSRGVTG